MHWRPVRLRASHSCRPAFHSDMHSRRSRSTWLSLARPKAALRKNSVAAATRASCTWLGLGLGFGLGLGLGLGFGFGLGLGSYLRRREAYVERP